MAWENGKNRLEALGEVEEAADLIRYYTHAMVEHDGFDVPMQRFSDAEATSDVMRPYGVWAVIAPFNYPAALVAGPAGAALVAGNTVVIKPSEIGSLCGHLIYDAFVDAGVPRGAINLVTGAGDRLAPPRRRHRLDGLTFTGSSTVGMSILPPSRRRTRVRRSARWGQESGHRHLLRRSRLAVEGTARSAFSFGGQKCSAASRVFVDDRSSTSSATTRRPGRSHSDGGPLERDGFLSPVVNAAALDRYDTVVADARLTGEVISGGPRLTDGTSVRQLRGAHRGPRARRLADLGHRTLPAGHRRASCRLARRSTRACQRGAVRAHRRTVRQRPLRDRSLPRPHRGRRHLRQPGGGATTGAWPGVQPFGGWKRTGRPARPAAGPTTCSSTCGSSPAPSSRADRRRRFTPSFEAASDQSPGAIRSTGRPAAVRPSTPVTVSATNNALVTASSVASTTAVKMSFELPRRRARSTRRACRGQTIGRRHGAEDVTAAVVGDRPDPGEPETDPAGDALELTSIERDVRDDDADAGAAGVERAARPVARRRASPDGHAPDAQEARAAEVAQQQHADRAGAVDTRRRADPRLVAHRDHAGPGADDPLGDGPSAASRAPRGRRATVSDRR